jgi:hypothetical protein
MGGREGGREGGNGREWEAGASAAGGQWQGGLGEVGFMCLHWWSMPTEWVGLWRCGCCCLGGTEHTSGYWSMDVQCAYTQH